MVQSLETLVALVDREGKDLDLFFLSITVLFLVASRNWPPCSPNILLLSLTENAGGLDHFRALLSFPVSHPYLQEVSMLLNFYFSPANLSFIQGGGCSAKHLE